MINKILIFAIKVYQLTLSSIMGRQCRFYPTCSDYTLQAIDTHGTLQGSLLSAKRICKCHPFNPGGFDPVPTNQNQKV